MNAETAVLFASAYGALIALLNRGRPRFAGTALLTLIIAISAAILIRSHT